MVLGRCNDGTDQMVKPTRGHPEDEVRSATGADRQKTGLLIWHELDVEGEHTLMNQLAS